jgi:hypothetical protein
MNLKRLFDFSPQARLWCQIAVFMFLFGLLAALGNGFGMGKMLEGFLFALGFFVLPFIALLLGVAALSEPYHLPRATLWAGATGVLAGGSLVASIMLAMSSEAGAINASAFWFGCCLPMLVPVMGVGLYFIVRGWAEARQEMAKEREARALGFIQKHGVVTLANLAAELRLPAEEAEALVQSLVENKTLFEGLFDAPRGAVYSPEAWQAKLEQLTDLAKGEPISLDEMAARIQAPRELVRDELRHLAQDHKLAGWLDGENGVFHRLGREQWEEISVCPSCGAAWSSPNPAEAGTIQCPQCRSEVFI